MTAPKDVAKGKRAEETDKKGRRALWPAAAVVVIALAAGGVYFTSRTQAKAGPVETYLTAEQVKSQITSELTGAGSFKLAGSPVTRLQFASFVHATSYITEAEKEHQPLTWKEPGFKQNDDDPVVCVDYNDACSFYAWLGAGFRLPTEAELRAAGQSASAGNVLQWVWSGGSSGESGPTDAMEKVMRGNSPAWTLAATHSMNDVGFRVGKQG
jgi:hypothetical protein